MMQMIFIDANNYASAKELHAALKMMLDLPGHYGCNADALHDCLSERRDQVNLVVCSRGEGETADALHKIALVVEDLGGEVRYL